MDEVVLFDALEEILCRAVCVWAGVPLAEPEARRRTREFGAMIEGAGSVGPRNWWGQVLRARGAVGPEHYRESARRRDRRR